MNRRSPLTAAFVHREARGDLPLLACLAVLVAVFAALSAIGPTALAQLQDTALRQRISAAQHTAPLITVTTQIQQTPVLPGEPAAFQVKPSTAPLAPLADSQAAGVAADGGPTLRRALEAQRTVLDYPSLDLVSPPARTPDVTAVLLNPYYVSDAAPHVRYLSGRAPADHTPKGTPPGIAVSRATADLLGLRVGEKVAAAPETFQPSVFSFVVSGIYQPVLTGDDFWTTEDPLDQPLEYPLARGTGNGISAGGLLGLDGPDLLRKAGLPLPTVSWQFQVTAARAAVAQSGSLTDAVQSYSGKLEQAMCGGVDPNGNPVCLMGNQTTGDYDLGDQLTPLLSDFTLEDQQFQSVVSFAIASLAAVGLATLVVAVRLLLRRRSGHLALRRARGASSAELVWTRTAAALPVCLPAGAAGGIAGLALSPGGTSGRPLPWAAVAVVVAALVLVPALTWLAVREPRTARRTRGRRPARGRRSVAEGTVLLLCVAGVTALRLRGASGSASASGVDVQLSAVPVLVAVTGVLVLLRVYPLVLGGLGAWARRGGGTVAFVGLRRAGRDASATGLALFVLVLTLGTAVFGGLVSQTVHDGTAVGARWTSGADAVALAAGDIQPAVGSTGPIRSVTERLRAVDLSNDHSGTVYQSVAVITVNQAALTAVDPTSPLVRSLRPLAGRAIGRGGGGVRQIPAVIDPGLVGSIPGSTFSDVSESTAVDATSVRFQPVGTLDAAALDDPVLGPITAQLPPGTLVVVAGQSADAVLPAQSGGTSTAVLFFDGRGVTTAALRTAASVALGPQATVLLHTDVLAALRGDGLTLGVGRVYGVCTVLAVLFALLAVALELVLTARERGRTTSYLRTLGLGGRAAAGLQVLQLVPLAVAAAVGGVLLGVLEPRVLGPALQLVEFTAGPGAPALHTDFGLTVGLGVGLAVLVLGAAVVETVVARMRRLESVLRLGEQ